MYAYSYKINNSYTVYVIPQYSKSMKKADKKVKVSTPKAQPVTVCAPMPQRGTLVQHKQWGIGKIVSTDKSGIMTVSFASKSARFLYPNAFQQHYLQSLS